MEDESTIADLKSSITILQEAMETCKKDVQSVESDKVLLVIRVLFNILYHSVGIIM